MKYVVVFAAEAQRNMDRIFQWLHDRSPQGALHWYEALLKARDAIALDPFQHGLAPESSAFPFEARQIGFKTRRGRTYRLIYRVNEQRVEILYVRGPGQQFVV